jgi:hypothetical protein
MAQAFTDFAHAFNRPHGNVLARFDGAGADIDAGIDGVKCRQIHRTFRRTRGGAARTFGNAACSRAYATTTSAAASFLGFLAFTGLAAASD